MTDTRWLDDREQTTWRAYLDSTRLLMQALDRQLERDSGISLTDYELLVFLSESPDRRLRMRDLADRSATTRSGVTRAINRLVSSGWVVRVDCEEDRRGSLAELTESGARKLADASPGHVAAVRSVVFDRLTADEVDLFGKICGDVRDRLASGDRHRPVAGGATKGTA